MEHKINSVGLEGMRGYVVTAEANVRDDKEACVITGLPDAPMKESKERLLSCLHNLSVDISMKKITVHLSPADQGKTGTGHDCVMLVSVLYEMCKDLKPLQKDTCFLATLSLSGNLLPFKGMIPSIQQALELGFKQIIVPPIDLSIFGKKHEKLFIRMNNINDLMTYLQGQQQIPLYKHLINLNKQWKLETQTTEQTDFSHIRGQEKVKKVLEIAATNPCPCGYYGSNERYCTCTPQQVRSYQLKVSGPFFDRFDFILPLKSTGLTEDVTRETSHDIRKRITKARAHQIKRYTHNDINARAPFADVIVQAKLTKEQKDMIKDICFKKKWSHRTYAKLIRIAPSIADLSNSEKMTDEAIEEAIKWKTLATHFQIETDNVEISNG